jgi:hypothetical protein
MDPTVTVPSVLLAALALFLIGWLLLVTFRALGGAFFGGLPFRLWLSLKKRDRRLETADNLIEQQQFAEALSFLRKSLILSPRNLTPSSLEAVVAHHLGVLSRFGTIADSRGIQSDILPLVEGLLTSRLELWRAKIEAKQSAKKVQTKMEAQGEERPWVTEEFQRRNEDIAGRLAANRQALEQQLEELCQELLSEPRAPISYPFH